MKRRRQKGDLRVRSSSRMAEMAVQDAGGAATAFAAPNDAPVDARGLFIVAVRVDQGEVVDPDVPLMIEVDVEVGSPGRLAGRVFVRTRRIGMVDCVAEVFDVCEPGPVQLHAEVPGGVFGPGKYAVDVEVWHDGNMGAMRSAAAKFLVSGTSDGLPSCLRLPAVWAQARPS